MRVCLRCGAENPHDGGFCSFCGSTLASEATPGKTEDEPSPTDIKKKIVDNIEGRKRTDVRISTVWALLPLLLILSAVGIYIVVLISFVVDIDVEGDSWNLYTLFYIWGRNVLLALFGILFALLAYKLISRMNDHLGREETLRAHIMSFLRASARPGGKEGEIVNELLRMSAFDGQAITFEKRLSPRYWFWGLALLFVLGSFGQALQYFFIFSVSDNGPFGNSISLVGYFILSIVSYFVMIAGLVVMFYLAAHLMRTVFTHGVRWRGFTASTGVTLRRLGINVDVPEQGEPLKERSVVLYAVLTIVTLGFFGIYWLYVLIKDPNVHFESQHEFEDRLLRAIQ